jgi:hypothetical protein
MAPQVLSRLLDLRMSNCGFKVQLAIASSPRDRASRP